MKNLANLKKNVVAWERSHHPCSWYN